MLPQHFNQPTSRETVTIAIAIASLLLSFHDNSAATIFLVKGILVFAVLTNLREPILRPNLERVYTSVCWLLALALAATLAFVIYERLAL
jgi:hypothetical protein